RSRSTRSMPAGSSPTTCSRSGTAEPPAHREAPGCRLHPHGQRLTIYHPPGRLWQFSDLGVLGLARNVLRRFAVLAALGMVAAASRSPSGGPLAPPSPLPSNPADITGTVRLLSYTDGFDPAYMASFHKEYPNIKLETSAMGSNEEAVAKLQAGFQADVINSCVDEATLEMVQKGLYLPLDTSKLTNWKDLFPSMQQLPGVQQDGKVYMVPVGAGTAGIVYNADVVNPPPTWWKDLFDPRWKGQASLEKLAWSALVAAARAK